MNVRDRSNAGPELEELASSLEKFADSTANIHLVGYVNILFEIASSLGIVPLPFGKSVIPLRSSDADQQLEASNLTVSLGKSPANVPARDTAPSRVQSRYIPGKNTVNTAKTLLSEPSSGKNTHTK